MLALFLLGAFASDAGRVGEDGTGAVWVAPELLEALEAPRLLGCPHEAVVEDADLQIQGRVAFEWHPDTGELSFASGDVKAPITLPEDFSAEPLAPATQNCGSR